ncbi:hypothetical protein [Tersicoccus phoenicis]|uniref:hypothetical protein n=1 Tax=Tersicoccus phoenicis TaxID=554083 RepID=UPI00117DE9AC|nr:hypothetical protein [Tersicoccus phoenicis]
MPTSNTKNQDAPEAFTLVADSTAELSRLLTEHRDHPAVRAGLDHLGAFGRRSLTGQVSRHAA